jgi:ribose transport system ATP-binding protein
LEKTPLIEALGIHKRFLAVHALNNVSASFYPGEVVAVMGENGAGKSTLMKCLAGVHIPSEGEIHVDGKAVSIPSVNRASELGVVFIHQELNLSDNLSVGANIFLGREPLTKFRLIDHAEIRRRTAELIGQLGMTFTPDTRVSDLSIGHQQMVEIAKALSQDARLLIMDEPTSSLTQHETEVLFKLVRDLRAKGLCIVFISHRLAEVKEISDRVIVLRDGKNSGELPREEIDHDRMVALMVGRELNLHDKEHGTAGDVLLKLQDVQIAHAPEEKVSFELRAGEIVAMAGLVGAGRTELSQAIFGIDRLLGGAIEVAGQPVKIDSPRDAIATGIAYVPEDRKQHGIIVEMPIRDNVVMAGLDRYQNYGFVQQGRHDQVATEAKEKLSVKTPTISQEVGLLSGGNQQKVVLAKWISLGPKVFLLDEPTRGIDVGSKSEIYEVIEEMAKEGAAVLFISSEMEEVLRVADRILVMHEGRLAGELTGADMNEERVMQLATGTN